MIRYLLEIYEEIGSDVIINRFSSAVRSNIDPSNATYPDSLGDPVLYPARLSPPSLNNKLSDSISGTVILNQNTISIANEDGKYDDVESLGWFNVPVVVRRSDKENPTLADFNNVFTGIIKYPVVTQNNVKLVINNIYRSLSNEVCKTFNIDDYPNIPDNSRDKKIPIGYGPDLMNVPLFAIDTTSPNDYIALDPDYLVDVDAVYDSDGNSIAFSETAGIITAVGAKTADVGGATGNTIGDIITSEIALKNGISYDFVNWDKAETDQYINNSGFLNFYFSGGSVRQLVDAVLKSDNAFLFTKNDGRLTLRQWGRTYSIHTIENWKIMQFPTKDFKEALRYYNSLAIIQYEKDLSSGVHQKQIASGINPAFGEERVVTYETDLYVTGEITDLGERMIKRFGTLSEIIKIASGKPTIDINLLDEVQIDVTINGRVFSSKKKWIVRESDPGQDILSLEAKSGFIVPTVIDGVLSQPYYNFIDGVLSQPFWFGFGNQNNSQPIWVTGEEL